MLKTLKLAVFNQNMAFLLQKEGFKSVQKFSDFLGEPRTKVAEYLKKSMAKPDFLQKLVDKFGIDLNMFLTIELDDHNYSRLFTSKSEGTVNEPSGEYNTVADFFEVVEQLRTEQDPRVREKLIQGIIKIHAHQQDAINALKDEIMKQQREKEDLFKRL